MIILQIQVLEIKCGCQERKTPIVITIFFNVVSRRKMSTIILRTIRNENSNKEQDDQCNLHDEHTTKNS